MVAAFVAPGLAGADSPGMTTLVYNFTYSADQSITARDSNQNAEAVQSDAISGGTNGISHYGGKLDDKGTMTVQVVGKPQADGGQVVTISEAGENTRRAPAATCVVYGNTHVICDPNKTVYTEEYTLLRFLGSKFVDPNALDKNKHWQISQDSPALNVTADYVIQSNSNGAMQISRDAQAPPGGRRQPDDRRSNQDRLRHEQVRADHG